MVGGGGERRGGAELLRPSMHESQLAKRRKCKCDHPPLRGKCCAALLPRPLSAAISALGDGAHQEERRLLLLLPLLTHTCSFRRSHVAAGRRLRGRLTQQLRIHLPKWPLELVFLPSAFVWVCTFLFKVLVKDKQPKTFNVKHNGFIYAPLMLVKWLL